MPVHGPFSADFKFVTLPDWPGGRIRCSDGQAAVFKSLWSFKGEPVTVERLMQRADLDSDKPIDVFKVKARDKGKPKARCGRLPDPRGHTAAPGRCTRCPAAAASLVPAGCLGHPSAMDNRWQ